MSKRSKQGLEQKPWKLLLWTAVAGLIFGLIGGGEYFEDMLRVSRNSFHQHHATGQVVVIKVDDQSLHQYGNWPWPRTKQAQLVDRLSAANAKNIVYDINFSFCFQRRGRSRLCAGDRAVRPGHAAHPLQTGASEGTPSNSLPLPEFAKHARLGVASVEYNWENAVWRLPYAATIGNRSIPSFAAAIAGVRGEPGTRFPLDYSSG